MLASRTALIVILASLLVGSCVGLGRFTSSPQKPQLLNLSGSGFAAGSFDSLTPAAGSLQLSPHTPSGNLVPLTRTQVLSPGPSGSADSVWASMPFVLRDTDGSYKMWYTGNGGNHVSILLATSPDGLNWTKLGVVLDLSNGADSPFVLKMGSTYHMWFTVVTWCCSPIGYQDQIYHTTSTDGMYWNTPVLAVGVGAAGSWDADTVSMPWIVQDASGLCRMFYGGWNDQALVQIGESTSADLVSWTPYAGNPVLTWGALGSWDSAALASPSVTRDGAAWTLFYAGRTNGSGNQIGQAFSSDGYAWTKDSANPVLRPEPAPAWDDHDVGSPDPFVSPIGLVMYFAGGDGTTGGIGRFTFAPTPGGTQTQSTVPLAAILAVSGFGGAGAAVILTFTVVALREPRRRGP